MRRPCFVVAARNIPRVTTVDETKGKWFTPTATYLVGVADALLYRVSQPGALDGGAKKRQRIDATARVDDLLVVPLPPRLVFQRTSVMIDGVQRHAARASGGTKPHGGTTAIRTDLHHCKAGCAGARREGCLVERIAFIWWHETLRCECNRAQRGFKHDERE